MEADSTVALYNFYGWLHANRKRVIMGVIVVVVLASVISLWVWHTNQNESDAGAKLLALPAISGLASQLDAAQRATLIDISQEYPGTVAGADAQLLGAKSLFLDGKFTEAEQAFAKFVSDHPGNPLIAQAQVGIAASFEGEGKMSDAVAKYKEVAAEYPSDLNIMIPIKFTLGRLNEEQNKPDAAAAAYEELARLNEPNNPWVFEARERLGILLASHPELLKAAAAAASPPSSSLLNPSSSEMQLSPAPSSAPSPAPNTNSSPAPKP